MSITLLRACLLMVCALSFSVRADVHHYVVETQAYSADGATQYYLSLLKLILNASKAPNEMIDFVLTDRHPTQIEWFADVQRHTTGNHVMCITTTKEREQLLRPIRFPIFKGLLGLRALVIRKEDKEKFSHVKNIDDLIALKAGQGRHWPDTDILRSNNLPVTQGDFTETLYQMLKGKRFDYFPRGIFELAFESKVIQENDFAVDDNVLLSYPMPVYLFVNKNNTEFAERLERGWEIIIKNGEFDKLFNSYPPVIAAIQELKKHKRHVIRLQNPFLTPETPLNRPELWFDASPYEH